jgi:hypothetical protein
VGIYHYPPPPPMIGGAQPYGPATLSPSITAVEVDTPPFTDGGPVPLPASVVAVAQPNAWTYCYLGAAQPFGPRTLSPRIPGQSVDLPPSCHPGRSAQTASLISLAQPDPWTFSFFGTSQPFGAKTLSPGIPGQDRDPPPFSHTGSTARTAALIALWQPDPWTYSFPGGRQPFAAKTLSPGIPGQDLDLPPPNHSARMASTAALIAEWQPDPWTFSFFGASQPFGAARLSPGIPGQDVDRPPFSHSGRTASSAALIVLWQPDPWTYSFFGARQPFAAKSLSPGIPGQDLDLPPPNYAGRSLQIAASLIGLSQPDPWTFSFFGTSQPFGVKTLSPGIPGQDIDRPPPYSDGGPIALKMQLVAQQQPDPWTYAFFGGAGPFLPRTVDAAIPGTSINRPPTSHPSRGQAMAAVRSAWDPPPPDYLVSHYARLPVPQGIFLGALPGTFTVAGINALLSIVEPAASGQFSETGIPATLTRDFVNWLPAKPIAGQWTPDNVMVIAGPESE